MCMLRSGVYICIEIYTHTDTYACKYISARVYAYMRMCIFICIHIYLSIYLYIYMHRFM